MENNLELGTDPFVRLHLFADRRIPDQHRKDMVLFQQINRVRDVSIESSQSEIVMAKISIAETILLPTHVNTSLFSVNERTPIVDSSNIIIAESYHFSATIVDPKG